MEHLFLTTSLRAPVPVVGGTACPDDRCHWLSGREYRFRPAPSFPK